MLCNDSCLTTGEEKAEKIVGVRGKNRTNEPTNQPPNNSRIKCQELLMSHVHRLLHKVGSLSKHDNDRGENVI